MSAWSVYLVECADGTLYCGVTNDLARRLARHDAGRGARYTRGRGPVRLVWSEAASSKGEGPAARGGHQAASAGAKTGPRGDGTRRPGRDGRMTRGPPAARTALRGVYGRPCAVPAGGFRTRLFTALAAALVALAAFPAAPAQGALPPGCFEEGESLVCEWTLDTTDDPQAPALFEFPIFPRTLATVSVVLRGEDAGWRYALYRTMNSSDREDWERLARSAHDPQPAAGRVASSTFSHLLLGPPEDGYALEFVGSSGSAGGARVGDRIPATLSRGTFEISYVALPLRDGTPPARPAATREDPQVADPARDAPERALDLTAAWLDDARLEDGLFDVHLAVRELGSLRLEEGPLGREEVVLVLEFGVEGATYAAHWWASPAADGPAWACEVRRGGAFGEPLSTLPCEIDAETGHLEMVVPEALVGNPAPGVRFTGLRAVSHRLNEAGSATPQDETSGERYPFALGGPGVWDELNPRLAVVPPPPAPWWRDPLSPDNLPNSLQVAGALLAAGTFVAGIVLVRRRRARVRRFLAEVDAAASVPVDASEASRALAALEARFDDLYRRGRMHEHEYQLAGQRLATAAARLALRRDAARTLSPGDETGGVPGDLTS